MKLSEIADLQEMSSEEIPEGWYKVLIDGRSSVKISESSNRPYANLWYLITKGEHEGRILFDNKSFQISSAVYLKPLLKAIGKSDDYEIVVDTAGEMQIPITEFTEKQLMVRVAYWKNKKTGGKDPKIVAYKNLVEVGEDEIIPF